MSIRRAWVLAAGGLLLAGCDGYVDVKQMGAVRVAEWL